MDDKKERKFKKPSKKVIIIGSAALVCVIAIVVVMNCVSGGGILVGSSVKEKTSWVVNIDRLHYGDKINSFRCLVYAKDSDGDETTLYELGENDDRIMNANVPRQYSQVGFRLIRSNATTLSSAREAIFDKIWSEDKGPLRKIHIVSEWNKGANMPMFSVYVNGDTINFTSEQKLNKIYYKQK